LVLAVFLGALTWWTPGTTAFMLEDGAPVTYQYVSLDHVSRYLIAAVIAHEDEQLGTRSGAFTFADFMARVSAYAQGKPDPSGSTIPQQLAKNVFLWPHQDPLRKAAEAILSTEMNAALSHQRTLELYVNYAQFGPHLYGVCAASWYYFGTAPWEMTQYQADQLMGVLPDPRPRVQGPGRRDRHRQGSKPAGRQSDQRRGQRPRTPRARWHGRMARSDRHDRAP
jgi:monofunctional biosynthetic peptidoglycan transglycosylase